MYTTLVVYFLITTAHADRILEYTRDFQTNLSERERNKRERERHGCDHTYNCSTYRWVVKSNRKYLCKLVFT